MIVVDATVLADYLVGDEALRSRVSSLMEQDPIWIAPSLWRYEVGNVLWKWVQFSGQAGKLAGQAIQTAEVLLEETVEDLDWTEVLNLACKSGCTYYDASYIWLARTLEIPLLTRDKKVLKHFQEIAKNY